MVVFEDYNNVEGGKGYMRKFLKERILALFQTMYEVHKSIEEVIEEKKWNNAIDLLADCQDAAVEIGTKIEEEKGEGFSAVTFLTEYCEEAYQIAMKLTDRSDDILVKEKLDSILSRAERIVKDEIKVKLEVVFCPYKVSMWDSLESIWKAAEADLDCDAYVVPIPYYDRNPDLSAGDFHYEGNEFPEDVPITHYEDYNFAQRRPDVIYIHNPYDEYNYVTSVDPRFYSSELKKYTDMLVYVPYFIAGFYSNEQTAKQNRPACIPNVDLWIAQSEAQKQALLKDICENDKVIALGSPKIDRVVNEVNHREISKELTEKINHRKTVLLNSSINYFLRQEKWEEKLDHLLDVFENDETMFLIWRPHPLLFSTVRAMRPSQKKDVLALIERFRNMRNVWIDDSPSTDLAFAVSDGMISDYSSLIMQYTATEKPVLILEGRSAYGDTDRVICCDYFGNYFIKDGITVEEFCSMLKDHRDRKKEERMRRFRNSMKNTDGTCGIKIHQYVKRKVGTI